MANLARYNVFDDVLGDLMKGFMVRPLSADGVPDLHIKIDVEENDKAYSVHADVPGVKKEDIEVTVDGGNVTIRAEVKRASEKKEGGKLLRSERYEGQISRSFQLPLEIDMSRAEAKYRDGVLDLTLPKKSGSGSKQLAVN